MIARSIFADLLHELQHERAMRLAAQAKLATALECIANHKASASTIARRAIAEAQGRPNMTHSMASAEVAAMMLIEGCLQ